jgi:microcystin-dependent protein
MADNFLAEIRIFAGNFAPAGWAFCNGQILPISQYTALFSLIGTSYGGNGTTNFQLPNLQNSTPLQQGQGIGLSLRDLGELGGVEAVTVLISQMPSHNHQFQAASGGRGGGVTAPSPTTAPSTGQQADKIYATTSASIQMNPSALSINGSGQPHNNMMPYLGINFIIALNGIFPSRG